MTFSLDEVAVWLPGRGVAVGPVSLAVDGLTVVTGRSGSGASTLVGAIAGTLPAGALVRGTWSPGVTVHHVPAERLRRPLDVTVHEALGAPAEPARQIWHEVTGLRDLSVRAPSLDPTTYATLPALRAVLAATQEHRRGNAAVLVVDQPLTHLTPDLAHAVAGTLRACADAGVPVLWIEHDLAVAVPLADTVVELHAGGEAVVQPARAWHPRSLPLPPQAALARALGLPRGQWWNLAALGEHPRVRDALATTGASLPGATTTVTVPGDRSTLPFDLDLLPGEVLGVVPAPGNSAAALEVARRIAAGADRERGPRAPLTWPEHVPLGDLVQRWCRAHGGELAEVLELAAPIVDLDPRRTLAQHSDGERSVARWALAEVSGRTEVVDHPVSGLDAHGRRSVARVWAGRQRPRATVAVTHDPEFLVRASHRVLVLPPGGTGTDAVLATPALAADLLPVAPVLRRARSRALRVRDVLREDR